MSLQGDFSIRFVEEDSIYMADSMGESIYSRPLYNEPSFADKQSVIQPSFSNKIFLEDSSPYEEKPENDYYSGESDGRCLKDQKLEAGGGNPQKKKRVDNTIFKTSLSSYRKSILQIIRSDSTLQWLLPEIKQVEALKNKSVFPKLHFMMHQLGLIGRIRPIWLRRSNQELQKKGQLLIQQKFTQQRYESLKKEIQGITKSFQLQELEEIIEEYWGNYRQGQKFNESKDQVLQFQKYFKNKIQQQRDCLPILKEMKVKGKPNKRKCKKMKKTKIISKGRFNLDANERTYQHEMSSLPSSSFLPYSKQNLIKNTVSSDFMSQKQ